MWISLEAEKGNFCEGLLAKVFMFINTSQMVILGEWYSAIATY